MFRRSQFCHPGRGPGGSAGTQRILAGPVLPVPRYLKSWIGSPHEPIRDDNREVTSGSTGGAENRVLAQLRRASFEGSMLTTWTRRFSSAKGLLVFFNWVLP